MSLELAIKELHWMGAHGLGGKATYDLRQKIEIAQRTIEIAERTLGHKPPNDPVK
jgi:hypothetical protein